MDSNGIPINENVCAICRKEVSSIDRDVAIVTRGLPTLLEYSEKYGDMELCRYLSSSPALVRVHNDCCRNFTSKRRFEQQSTCTRDDVTSGSSKVLRSSSHTFNWKTHRFFCSEVCELDTNSRRVETLEIRDKTLHQCLMRGDSWSLEVQGRLTNCCDLVAEEALYHKSCHRDFDRTNVQSLPGRLRDSVKQETFDKVCMWLEANDRELLTLQDVVNKATSLSGDNEGVYSEKWIKSKLIRKYGSHVQFNEVHGRRNVICWKDFSTYVINQKWHDDNRCSETEHVVITAAKLLRSVIREASYAMDVYPDCNDVHNCPKAKEWMPQLLQIFMENLVVSEEKQCALGQCIVQSVRPQSVIAPIPFALGVSVDNVSSSKFLVNLLYQLGLSVSYDEIYRYKHSVVQCDSTSPKPPQDSMSFVQFAADNVDHDVCSLDGSGTLHAMGIISISYHPDDGTKFDVAEPPPVRRLKVMKAANIAEMKHIPVVPCTLPPDSLTGVAFQTQFHAVQSSSVNLDLLWHVGWFLKAAGNSRPSWAGFNSSISSGNPVTASDIRLLPIIDNNPNEPATVYSTLMYVAREAQKLQLGTPVITLDQPLWLKAMKVINSQGLDILCRLGAFHAAMSFLGSLGVLMDGSGLTDAMECCYRPNSVKRIMYGLAKRWHEP